MPEMNGIEAAGLINNQKKHISIIALSMHNDFNHYQSLIKVGVKGFIQKSSGIDDIETSIKVVAQGGTYFSNEVLHAIISNMEEEKKSSQQDHLEISKREREVLKYVCLGMSNEQIAQQLFISPTTVKGHRANLLSKTGVKNTAALIMFAVKNKLVEF